MSTKVKDYWNVSGTRVFFSVIMKLDFHEDNDVWDLVRHYGIIIVGV